MTLKDITVKKLDEDISIDKNKSFEDILSAEVERMKQPGEEKLLPKEIYLEIDKRVKQVPISKIITSRIQANNRGECLCPFHADTKTGSFKYDDKLNKFTCFTCKETGDGIAFVQKLSRLSPDKSKHKDYNKAVFEIAAQFQIIPQELFELLTGEKLEVEINSYTPVESIGMAERTRSDINVTDFFFKQIMSASFLSTKHRDYLNNRGVSNEEIKEVGYFTLFKNKKNQEDAINSDDFKRELLKVMKNSGYAINSLESVRVPGVYFENGKFLLSGQEGLVIPIKDVNGKIQALQTRRDEVKEGESRYSWITSTGHNLGATPGTPIDVYVPVRDNDFSSIHTSLILSEGHFKIRRITKEQPAPAFSFQGIQNIQELDKNLEELYKYSLDHGFRVDTARIFYDMDMYKNLNVYNAMLKLIDKLTEDSKIKNKMFNYYINKETGNPETMITSIHGFNDKYDVKKNICVEIWDPRIGKGADDFLDNGGLRFAAMHYEDFTRKFENEYLTNETVVKYFDLKNQYSVEKLANHEDHANSLKQEFENLEPDIERIFCEVMIEDLVGYTSPQDAFREEMEELGVRV